MNDEKKQKYTTEFKRIGLDDTNINNFLKNEAKCANLLEVILEANIPDTQITKFVSNALVQIAGKVKSKTHRPLLLKYIREGKFTLPTQIDAAIKYISKVSKDDKIDIADFEKTCGVGVTVTKKDIQDAVKDVIQKNIEELKRDRYCVPQGPLLRQVLSKPEVKWAAGKDVAEELDKQIKELLGPKTEKDEEMIKSYKKKPVLKKPEKKKEEAPKVRDKFEARELEAAKNTQELLRRHKEATGGIPVITRFPPEPNGYLHIGHAKAMNLSFGLAEEKGGKCILRFDDTNPEKEEDVYIKSIIEMVEWLGFKPWKITHTSDYFPQLHQFAIELIKKGLAYVDTSSSKEIQYQKENRLPSPCRDRPIEESLKLFENMRRGMYEEGEMCLRCKVDYKHDNVNMRDFVAYRIKYTDHPNTKDQWCIYPTYDFSHGIVDSLEWITHSLCTLEFEIRREQYYWPLEKLNLYRPYVWEFSRLNVSTSMLSKRRILKLVQLGVIRGWDDPRLLTLAGLRRRGYTPEAIKNFCRDVGVTRNTDILIPIERLEQSCRVDLDERCDRKFAVMEPLKVIIENYPEDKVEYFSVPNHPKKKERGTRQVPFSKVLYIEKSDFRLKDEKDYFGLAPNKEVGLRYGPNITCTKVVFGKNNEIVELHATADFDKKNKPKGHIHWLAQPAPGKDPLKAELRLYTHLFTIAEPQLEEDWEKYIDKNSEIIKSDAFVDPSFSDKKLLKNFSQYQFERLGYFSVDPDTTDEKIVFNRTVQLKESYPKFAKETKKPVAKSKRNK